MLPNADEFIVMKKVLWLHACSLLNTQATLRPRKPVDDHHGPPVLPHTPHVPTHTSCPVSVQFYDIKDMARKYISSSTPGLALQWLFFGHNNKEYTEDVPLPTRFTRRNAHTYVPSRMHTGAVSFKFPSPKRKLDGTDARHAFKFTPDL